MKKFILFFLLIILVLFFCVDGFAQSKATSMGDLVTVSSTGPFDVIRNPALLPNQTSNNSFGFFYTYIHHISDENKMDLNMNMDGYNFDSKIKVEDPKIIGMTCNLAYLSKSGNAAFGFAVTSLDNEQYRINESEIYTYSTNGTYEIQSHEETKENIINPVFITSAGFTVAKNSYFGLQLLIKYSKSSEEKKSEAVVTSGGSTVEEEKEKDEKIVNAVSGELGFGYLYKTKDFQMGLLLRSGDFSWIKKELKVDYYDGTINYHSDSDITLTGEKTSGLGISVGGYYRVNTFFAFALESVFVFENTYPVKEFQYIKDENRIEKEESIVRYNSSVAFKGGIELNPSKDLAITMGLGYALQEFESSNGHEDDYRSMGDAELNFIYFTSGFEYMLKNNISINILSAWFHYKNKIFSFHEEDDGTDHEEMMYEVRASGYFIFTGVGVVLAF